MERANVVLVLIEAMIPSVVDGKNDPDAAHTAADPESAELATDEIRLAGAAFENSAVSPETNAAAGIDAPRRCMNRPSFCKARLVCF